MFHISDIKKYLLCQKSFWLNMHGEKNPFIAYNHLEEGLSLLIKERLKAENTIFGYRGMNADESLRLCEENEWLSKMRFEYQNLRVKIPFMHKTEKGWDIYFIQMAAASFADDIQYYTDNIWVLRENGLTVHEIFVLRINNNYLYEDNLDLQQLFTLSRYVNDDVEKGTLKDAVENNLTDLNELLAEMQRCCDGPMPLSVKNKNCIRRNRCSYYDNCFESEKQFSCDSILTLSSSRYKNEMFAEGIKKLCDADLNRLEGTKLQYAQIMASKSNSGRYIDTLSLEMWLRSWQPPFSFVDFEWETYVLPPFPGLKPYCKVPFQYSLHIMDERGEIEHREFLGINDCRKDFILSLIRDIPSQGSIIAYNADGAEKLRLQELAIQFPEYADQLNELCTRMIDLSIPFQNGMVYDLQMRGYSSLKVLLPICDSGLTYRDLDIHDGMMAVAAWRKLCDEPENKEEIRKNLLTYCGLDSYSMIVVYRWLIEQLRKRED